MKIFSTMLLTALLTVTVSCKKDSKSSSSGGSTTTTTTQPPQNGGTTNGTNSGNVSNNDWDPDFEEGWWFPDWGDNSGSGDDDEVPGPVGGGGTDSSDDDSESSGGTDENASGSSAGSSSGSAGGTSSGSSSGTISDSEEGSGGEDSEETTSGSTAGGASSGEDVTPGYGYLTVNVTDAPFPFDWIESAKVTLVKLEAQKVGFGYVKVHDEPAEFDLMQLRNGITATLTKAKLPIGNYDRLKMYVTKGVVKLKDGREFSITIPSGATNGIQVLISPIIKVYTGVTSEVLLDIDVAKSFIPKGNLTAMSKITGFSFKPVARAANVSMSGSLSGKVLNDNGTPNDPSDDKPIVGALVRLTRSGQTVVSTVSTTGGAYKIIGVPATTGYSALYAAIGYDSKEFSNLEIESGVNKEVTARLNPNPQAILPLSVDVIKEELVKRTSDIVAEVSSYNTSVSVEATNGLQVRVMIIDSRVFIAAKANSLGTSVVTITDKKGQTSSFEVNQIAQ